MFRAWLIATIVSGMPSTLYALFTGGDVLEATRAAGAMLLRPEAALPQLLIAAAFVHAAVSSFWALVLTFRLPRRHVAIWAMIASAVIAIIDLCVIAPIFFPEVAALAFWPQFADHLAWGAGLGITLYSHTSKTGTPKV